MYFLVVIFPIRATSSPLSALLFMIQIVVYTIRLNVSLHMYIENRVTYMALKILKVLCSIWSLDIFCCCSTILCEQQHQSCSCTCTCSWASSSILSRLSHFDHLFMYKTPWQQLYDVVWVWKPFHRRFAHLRRRWDSTASIINAFTAFLLLSFSKISFVSFTLLYTFPVVYDYGDIPSKCVLYYDPTVECHKQEYIIFSAIAYIVLVISIICPTILLILYPTRLFRRCVAGCGFWRWHALHVCGIISGTVQEWDQWYSWLQNGFCIIPHPQNTDTSLVPKSPSLIF